MAPGALEIGVDSLVGVSFATFLQNALRRCYHSWGQERKAAFLKLAVASGQSLALLEDFLSAQKLSTDAIWQVLSLAALRKRLIYLLKGPLGTLLGLAAAAGLIHFIIKHRNQLDWNIAPHRAFMTKTETRFDEIQNSHENDAEKGTALAKLLDDFVRQSATC